MSQYFYAVCHDCKVIAEVSNVSLTQAEEHSYVWAHDRRHEQHKYEVVSEYDQRYEDGAFRGYEERNDWW